jgi:hypothetical protein
LSLCVVPPNLFPARIIALSQAEVVIGTGRKDKKARFGREKQFRRHKGALAHRPRR